MNMALLITHLYPHLFAYCKTFLKGPDYAEQTSYIGTIEKRIRVSWAGGRSLRRAATRKLSTERIACSPKSSGYDPRSPPLPGRESRDLFPKQPWPFLGCSGGRGEESVDLGPSNVSDVMGWSDLLRSEEWSCPPKGRTAKIAGSLDELATLQA